MRYTLRQLEVFLAVARVQGVGRAGPGLSLSQSAVSGSLADIERQFDIRLFDRIGKRLTLSELGRSVRAQAEAILDRARDLESVFADGQQVGRLRVGATLTIGNHLAVPILARLQREHPGSEVTLAIANTAEIARQVANFEIDVGLIEGEIEHPELEVLVWRPDHLAVFCAPDHVFARKRKLTDANLLQASWIVREQGSGTRQTFDRAMSGLLPQLKIALALQHTEAIKAAVKAGLGLGCVSRMAVQDEFARGTLRECAVPHRDFGRRFYFLLHKKKYRSPTLEKWLALCRQTVGAAS